jgi:hypothetical protein
MTVRNYGYAFRVPPLRPVPDGWNSQNDNSLYHAGVLRNRVIDNAGRAENPNREEGENRDRF